MPLKAFLFEHFIRKVLGQKLVPILLVAVIGTRPVALVVPPVFLHSKAVKAANYNRALESKSDHPLFYNLPG